MTEAIIGEDKAQIYAARAQEMWGRALTIVGNETKREVALAVITAHLGEYKSVPQDFLTGAVFAGLLAASRIENEIKDRVENPQIVEKAMLAKDLLIESGILRVAEADEYHALGKGMTE